MIKNREDFKEEHEGGWKHNLVIQTVLNLLAGPFNNDNYRLLELEEAKNEAETYLNDIKGTTYEKRANRIIKKIKSKKTVSDIIIYLGEVILND